MIPCLRSFSRQEEFSRISSGLGGVPLSAGKPMPWDFLLDTSVAFLDTRYLRQHMRGLAFYKASPTLYLCIASGLIRGVVKEE
jgi:hypothetical protein